MSACKQRLSAWAAVASCQTFLKLANKLFHLHVLKNAAYIPGTWTSLLHNLRGSYATCMHNWLNTAQWSTTSTTVLTISHYIIHGCIFHTYKCMSYVPTDCDQMKGLVKAIYLIHVWPTEQVQTVTTFQLVRLSLFMNGSDVSCYQYGVPPWMSSTCSGWFLSSSVQTTFLLRPTILASNYNLLHITCVCLHFVWISYKTCC